ncbi:MAG: methyltransferase domain-containing protein [Opitutaceae bacterium]
MSPEPESTERAVARPTPQAGGEPRLLFSHKVADYEASRPDYPEAFFQMLQVRLPIDAEVADLGAGTGLLTRDLLRHQFRCVAIEPDAAMLAVADQQLSGTPGYRGVVGRAEAIPLPAQSVDLVTAAQAFHWFDPMRTRAECLRVLRPGGFVALVWNDRVADDPLQRALETVLASRGKPKQPCASEKAAVAEFFAPVRSEELVWLHEHRLNLAGLTSLVFSRSYMPERDSAAGRDVEGLVREVFAGCAREGRVTVRYRTVAFVGRPG